MVAALWLLDTVLHVSQQILFSLPDAPAMFASSVLYLSAGPVLAALVASAIAGLRERTFALAASLLIVDCIATLWWLATEWAFQDSGSVAAVFGWMIMLIAALMSARAARRAVSYAPNRWRRIAAILAAVLIFTGTPFVGRLDAKFLELSARLAPEDGDAEGPLPDIDYEKLWTSQPALVDQALADVQPVRGGKGTAYLVTVAADGSQQVFGREARAARAVLGRAFGSEQRSILLGNDQESLYRAPLAANTNLDQILAGLSRKMKAPRDLAVIYLTSHGSAAAELTTDLPNYSALESISASRLARALDRAGIRRRIVIVSACHAGSWIRPLATDDTVLIAAARADRASFGCSDDRELTYFGEAFLKAPVAANASLSERFDAARHTVARWEAAELKPPSEPQAFVGRNMTAVWRARPSAAATIN